MVGFVGVQELDLSEPCGSPPAQHIEFCASFPVRPRCTGNFRHPICVISPTIRLQRWVRMKKNSTSLTKEATWFCCLVSFSYPALPAGEEQEMFLESCCSAFLGQNSVLFQFLGSWNSMAVDLENSIYFILFYSFVSMFGWTPGFLTQQSHIYMCIYILYNHSQGQLKSHYFIFQLCKNCNFLVSSWPESAAFSFQAAGDQLDQQMTTCELYAKLSTLLSVGSIPRTQEMVFYCSYKNYHLLA